jgi:hypothetical protein
MRVRERRSVPVWIVKFLRVDGKVPRSRFVAARTAAAASKISHEFGRPLSITYAGFQAEPHELDRPKNFSSRIPASRRAEAALTLYSIIRTDWPIPSLLRESKRLSSGLLRDFVADVGRAIAQVPEAEIVADVAEAQGLAWAWSARGLNARRQGRQLEADLAFEKRDDYRARARRLRKRKAYSLAVGELELRLNGVAEGFELVGLNFIERLVRLGYSVEEASDLARRFQRIGIPRA